MSGFVPRIPSVNSNFCLPSLQALTQVPHFHQGRFVSEIPQDVTGCAPGHGSSATGRNIQNSRVRNFINHTTWRVCRIKIEKRVWGYFVYHVLVK